MSVVRLVTMLLGACAAAACASAKPTAPVAGMSPATAAARPATAAGQRTGRPQAQVVRGPTFVRPNPVNIKRVKILIPAVDGAATCRVLTGVPTPNVATTLILRFTPSTQGERNISVGLAADGTPVHYADLRGDLTRGPDLQPAPGARSTSISIDLVQLRAFISNDDSRRPEVFMVVGEVVRDAAPLGNPQAMIARAQRECAGVTPQAVSPATTNAPIATERVAVRALKTGLGSPNPEDFTPAFPATDSGAACVSMPALPLPGVVRSLHMRFRVNGLLVRDISLQLDSAGAPVMYQDNRSANLQDVGGPFGSASTSIFLDFRKGTAQLSNITPKGGLELANVKLTAAMDAQSIGVPSAMIYRLRTECEKR